MTGPPRSSNKLRTPTNITSLAPELFLLVSRHIPRLYRPASLLTLALTCRRLHEVVIPRLLYHDVRLEGDATWALSFLEPLRAAAELTSEKDVQLGNIPLSHHIHSLCIRNYEYCTEFAQIVLYELRLLIQCGGLRNLQSFTIHLRGDLHSWDGIDRPFWRTAKAQCPRLTEVHLSGIPGRVHWLTHSGIFKLQLESLRINHIDFQIIEVPNLAALLTSFTALHHLELLLSFSTTIFPIGTTAKNGLLTHQFPHLHTLILDGFSVVQPKLVRDFWRCHPGLETLALGYHIQGAWFQGFTGDMLPNLAVLSVSFPDARILLPHVAKRLKSLTLMNTCNAQAPYLLRAVVPDGILPMLRSLTIHILEPGHAYILEGNRWREDEEGRITETGEKEAQRWFDGNYLTSVAKAAPRLQELYLSGNSSETLENFTSALSRMSDLETLVISGPVNVYHKLFFVSSALPQSFEQAARELARGCATLQTICAKEDRGPREMSRDLACQVIRDDRGTVKAIDMRKNGGMTISREDECRLLRSL